MAKLPVNMNSASFKLDDTYFALKELHITHDDYDREYCGMSSLGNKCLRALQYMSRRVTKGEQVEPRVQRIFDLGHILEAYIIANLNAIGMQVTNQQREIVGFAGHWKGHIDGEVINVPEAPKTIHLLEIKSHNDKSFKDMKNNGLQASKPGHYAQMMRYMRGNKDSNPITRGLYVAYNKNDSGYYTERIPYDAEFSDELIYKEQEVLLSEQLFPRIGTNSPNWHECKYCDYNAVCFGNKEPNVNCRTCRHVDMLPEGQWACGIDNRKLTYKDQMRACSFYAVSDMLR